MLAHLSLLLSLATVAVTVAAKPIVVRDSLITLPLARRFNVTGVPSIVKQDQARARVLQEHSQGKGNHASSRKAAVFPVDATNQAVTYTVTVGVGTPPTNYTLVVDTGSSNTWVGAGTHYVRTNSSVKTGDEVLVEYGSGLFFGQEYIDTVTLGALVIPQQSIGVATISEGFDGVDGILGIGPVNLTEGTTSSGGEIPTVHDTAFSQGSISKNLIGISFEPTTALEVTNGVLTFGGVDDSKHTGDIAYVPITSTSPASSYVGYDQSITYGTAGTTILSNTAGIHDTGTTLCMMASNAFAVYRNVTGAVPDATTGLLKITEEQLANLESLFFHIGDETYEFTANAQLWPRALNTAIGGEPDSIYLIVGDIGSNSGEGLDFINGMTFLERYYSVYDAGNSRVGFAPTEFTYATSN